jgi:hypothetical protein
MSGTLIIATIGLALSVASVTWQAATFFLSGSRVKVSLRRGVRHRDGVAHWPAENAPPHAVGDVEDELLGIQVVNHGRMAAYVTGWSAVFENGTGYLDPGMDINPTITHRLEPGSREIWWASVRNLRGVIYASNVESMRVWMAVDLGTGKGVRTKTSVKLTAKT